MILKIKKCHGGAVKVRAEVGSDADPFTTYRVGYIRSKSFRGFVCTCEDFFNRRIGTNRNCKHIKEVRQTYGRYATKVQ